MKGTRDLQGKGLHEYAKVTIQNETKQDSGRGENKKVKEREMADKASGHDDHGHGHDDHGHGHGDHGHGHDDHGHGHDDHPQGPKVPVIVVPANSIEDSILRSISMVAFALLFAVVGFWRLSTEALPTPQVIEHGAGHGGDEHGAGAEHGTGAEHSSGAEHGAPQIAPGPEHGQLPDDVAGPDQRNAPPPVGLPPAAPSPVAPEATPPAATPPAGTAPATPPAATPPAGTAPATAPAATPPATPPADQHSH